ncbi:L-type lectin-domain containing receptor kinase S.6 [Linum grandiflorum]
MHYPIFLLFFFLFFISTNSLISLPPPAHNLTFYGDAHFRNDAITLTQDHPCSSSSSSTFGRALYFRPFRFLDPKTNSTASFSSRFIFSIIQSPLCPPADGLAFLITSSPNSFSLSDGFMGLPGPALNPRDSFVAVEFDTNYDSSLQDPTHGDHVGVDVNTIVSFAEVSVSGTVDLKSGKEITAWIDYSDSAKSVQVWLSYSQSRPPSPILVAKADLSNHFKEFMFVGFSASNGKGSAVHLVTHWRFNTYGHPSFNSTLETIDQGNCVICVPTEDDDHEQNSRKRRKNLALGLGGLAALVVSMILILIVSVRCMLRRRLQWHFTRRRTLVNSVPSKMSIWEIKAATMGFSRARIVGEGASATVYKGSLPASGAAVAIKRFDRAGIDCTRNPFVTEFATMAGCLKHKNLVQLQGWCCEGPELVLVYDYFPNGSLDRILHKNGSSVVLSWKQRMNILAGVASALSYLHEECERQIIHRDVKACNILLDSDFNAKLGDFGLAEVYEHSSLTREATIPAGTMGYLAPEYVYCGVPTQKTDVYSYGVVVLEVATGRRPVMEGGGGGTVLVDWVWGCWERGKLIEAADPKLNGEFSVGEMERVLIVGVACVHPNPEKRPTVKEAARILKGEAPLPALPARKPKVGFQYGVAVEDDGVGLGVGKTVVVSQEGDQSPGTDEVSWMSPMSHFGLTKDAQDSQF